MTSIEVPDWVVARARSMLETCGYSPSDSCIRATVRAALGAWVVPAGVRYRVAPNDACRARPWEGAGIVAEWNRSLPNSSETLQYQPLYVLRQEKPE